MNENRESSGCRPQRYNIDGNEESDAGKKSNLHRSVCAVSTDDHLS